MKTKENLLLLTAAVLCTLLFYHEHWGLNVWLFSLMIPCIQCALNRSLLRNYPWLAASAAGIVSAGAYYFTGSAGACFLFVLSMLMASGLQVRNALLLFLPFHAFLNLFIAPAAWGAQTLDRLLWGKHSKLPLRLLIIPVFLFTLFLLLYAIANTALLNQLASLFSGIDLTLVLAFVLSFLVVLPLILGRLTGWLSWIENFLETIIGWVSDPKPTEDPEKKDRLRTEALLVFYSLIALLGYMILLDVTGLVNGTQDATMSGALHASIYTLIASMMLAIGVILYYFSLPLVYDAKAGQVKTAVSVWIGLNVILCVICLIKNNLYVQEYGLTYKRLGVYAYLICTGFALLITAYKTHTLLSNWKLLKANCWMLLGVWVVFFSIPWDVLITRYNIRYTQDPDIAYIVSLSDRARMEYIRLMMDRDKEKILHAQLKEDLEKMAYRVDFLQQQSLLSQTGNDRQVIQLYHGLQKRISF